MHWRNSFYICYKFTNIIDTKEALNSKTKAEIQRLGAKKVYLIGGENSISKEIEQQLKSLNISIERISGSDRYKTSLLLAQKLNGIKMYLK